jgi:hypothetical protein
VVYAFRFLGQPEDVPRIVRWVEGFRGQAFVFPRAEDIIHAQNSLAVMARRGVEGARPALEKMMVPDYWRGLSVTISRDDGVEHLGGSFCYLAIRAAVSGAYTRDPDFKAKVGKIAEKITDPKERKAYSDKIREVFDDYDAYMADGLFPGQRFELGENREGARLRTEKKPEKPSGFAYNEAFYRWTVGKAELDPAVRDRLVREAREAFEGIAKDLSENKREAVVTRMCNYEGPFVLQDVDPPQRATELVNVPEKSVYLDLQQAVVKSLASCHLDESAAIVKLSMLDSKKKDRVDVEKAAAEPEKNVDLIFVQIPYSDAEGVKASDGLFLNPVMRFTESRPEGKVTLCMMWQAGHWYWVPFGQ